MTTWTEYMKNLRNNVEGIITTTLEREIATDAIALIRNRIATRGEKAEGGLFKPYSRDPILVGASSFETVKARNKVFGSKKKRREADWRTVRTPKGNRALILLPGGYAKIRELEGRQTAHKDFERTSAMWKSIHVLGVESSVPGHFTAIIGSRVPKSNKKLDGNQAREGAPILALSEKELATLTDLLLKRIVEKL